MTSLTIRSLGNKSDSYMSNSNNSKLTCEIVGYLKGNYISIAFESYQAANDKLKEYNNL